MIVLNVDDSVLSTTDPTSPDHWRRIIVDELQRPGYSFARLWRERLAPALGVPAAPPPGFQLPVTAESALLPRLRAMGQAAADLFDPFLEQHGRRRGAVSDAVEAEIRHTKVVVNAFRRRTAATAVKEAIASAKLLPVSVLIPGSFSV